MFSQTIIKRISNWIALLLSSIALLSILPLSYQVLLGNKSCPTVFKIPLCHVITIGYALLISSFLFKRKALFYIGWVPVFLFASFGTISEIISGNACPRSEGGIPLCYYSLIIALLIGGAHYLSQRQSNDR
ncbi:hypothetical protein MLD52_19440 [Puniceicoccaceae bacterium K14]|nr:hypothetical protein [Puniceicoccaceae bacterium K14]